jgi:hypothetical protein
MSVRTLNVIALSFMPSHIAKREEEKKQVCHTSSYEYVRINLLASVNLTRYFTLMFLHHDVYKHLHLL